MAGSGGGADKKQEAGATNSDNKKGGKTNQSDEKYVKPPVKMPPKRKPWKVKKEACCHEYCTKKSDPANYPIGYPWASGKLKCLPGYCQDHKEASEEEELARARAIEDAERIFRESQEKCKRQDQQNRINAAADELKFFLRLLSLTNDPSLIPNFKKKLEKYKKDKEGPDSAKPAGQKPSSPEDQAAPPDSSDIPESSSPPEVAPQPPTQDAQPVPSEDAQNPPPEEPPRAPPEEAAELPPEDAPQAPPEEAPQAPPEEAPRAEPAELPPEDAPPPPANA